MMAESGLFGCGFPLKDLVNPAHIGDSDGNPQVVIARSAPARSSVSVTARATLRAS